MNSLEILQLLDRIADTPSKNEKQALVSQNVAISTLFIKVLEYAYNPFKTYGIRPCARRR